MATVTLTQAQIDKTRKTLNGHRELVQSTLRNARLTRDRELELIAERDSLVELIAKFPPKPKAKKAAKASSK